MFLELLAGHAGLDRGVQIVGADAQDAVHARHVDRDAAVDRIDVAFERRAGAERHDRAAVRWRRRATMAWTASVLSGNTTACGSAAAMMRFAAAVMLADGVGG